MVSLKGVTFPNPKDKSDQFYFLAATAVLVVTALLIIGACFGSIYFFYKLTFGNRERYFQFEDKVPADIELADRRNGVMINLSKIEEEADEEYESSVVKKKEGASLRSSISTTRP